MSSTSIIPFEIQETIINILAENGQDISSVKVCSHVCHAFLPLCRRHIFGSIVLNVRYTAPPSPTTRMLERLLFTTPEISNYIRKLQYNIVQEDLTSLSIQRCLKQISRLQFLSVCDTCNQWGPKLDWSKNCLRPALLHLLHLPTLNQFKILAINNFPLSDLVSCLNLKKLDIGHDMSVVADSTTLDGHSIHLKEFVSGTRNASAIIKICQAQYFDGRPLIDFSSLANITVVLHWPHDIEALQELFRHCEQLTDVQISFREPRRICPSIANMLRPSMQTLRRVYLHICFTGLDDHPLANIFSEFEDMRSKNNIEKITIEVLVDAGGDYRPGDTWHKLDQVLARSGWIALKQVSLIINLSSWLINQDLEISFQELPGTQFPQLSTNKSIAFIFEVTTSLV